MTSRRSASVRESTSASQLTSNRRRNPPRNATSSASAHSQTEVAKPRLRANVATRASSNKTRLAVRPHTGAESTASETEPSSEEQDDSDDGSFKGASQKTTNRRQSSRRAALASPSVRRTSAAGNHSSSSQVGATRKTAAKTGTKRGRPRKSPLEQRDSASEPDSDQDDEDDEDTATKTSGTRTSAPKRRRGRPLRKKKATDAAHAANIESPIIPDWLDLRMEHAIWKQIFRYAAVTGDEQDVMDVNWLLQTARVCRTFVDPALTVLYTCPPVKDEIKAQRLAQLLEEPPSTTAINYRAKIEALHIDVRLISLQGFSSPIRLLQKLPRLSEVLLSHGFDQAPYRRLKDTIKWTYPSELWEAFDMSANADADQGDKTRPTRLQSWQWSSRLMDKNWEGSLARMKEIHQLPSFASLQKIRLINYQLPSVRLERDPAADPELQAEDNKSAQMVADSLSVLESLEQLAFESSTIISSSLFPLLPSKLKRLELVNCAEVTADNLGSFLLSNGHQLEALTLNHNRSLSLAFLTLLGDACPHLAELHGNFKYFSLLETVDDNDPFFDHLLLPDQVPSWPSALETVRLENLRQWNMEAAEVFLQSFIDSAPTLPMLRHLSIKAMLDIPWRSRSGFRKSWQEKLEKVFLRHVVEPEPNFSLRSRPDSEVVEIKRRSRKSHGEPTRRSSRVVADSRRSSRGSSSSRGLRENKRKPQSYREPDSDEFESDGDVDMEESEDVESVKNEEAAEESGSTFVQGLCSVVDINVDNQKPREHQYSMDDFLNDDRDFETDEDWDGHDNFE
ncbi:hypothetical protein C8035_v002643 [Colletotrichum spinosum]|uniref:Uncharacterized protein n=1 Tax=Colletotrichum spinosum TaxID=1347390 RepID=A0A4R8QB69_9PEZI|nr:hypothetical protein C8035_v002643 [Colletotrichum spinosum]